jgi:hypothetical protein
MTLKVGHEKNRVAVLRKRSGSYEPELQQGWYLSTPLLLSADRFPFLGKHDVEEDLCVTVTPLLVPGRVVVVRIPAQLRPVTSAHARNCQTYD